MGAPAGQVEARRGTRDAITFYKAKPARITQPSIELRVTEKGEDRRPKGLRLRSWNQKEGTARMAAGEPKEQGRRRCLVFPNTVKVPPLGSDKP